MNIITSGGGQFGEENCRNLGKNLNIFRLKLSEFREKLKKIWSEIEKNLERN